MIKPQLLKEVSDHELSKLLESDQFALSQKLDGRRLIVEISDLSLRGWARSGLEAEIPKYIASDFSRVRSDWTFDGELICGHYYVFDILHYPAGDLVEYPWIERQKLLNTVLTDFSDAITVVEQRIDPPEKMALFDKCLNLRTEGVVLCNINSRYLKGVRSSRSLKYKFTKTIDCVIIDAKINSKDNLVLGLYNENGELLDVGKVSAVTGDGKYHDFSVGEVVTVEYLYATKSNRLYQPVKPRLRKDKESRECLMSQMIHQGDQVASLN